jgi:hypothetical protein
MQFEMDLTLLQGVMCLPRCMVDKEFRIEHSGSCLNCVLPDQIPVDETAKNVMFPSLKMAIKPNVGVVVFNTGAWYIPMRGVLNATVAYEKMLLSFKPKLKLLAARKLVIWMNIHIMHESVARFHELVRVILADTGVLIIDPSAATRARIAQDKLSTVDGQHHSNPSPSGILNLIASGMFHVIAQQYLLCSSTRGRANESSVSHCSKKEYSTEFFFSGVLSFLKQYIHYSK